ncbi:MAG TPA: helicase, partial [Polyangia bacterium]
MPTEIAKIVASLRRACKAGVWSAGVNLVRAGAVTVESRSDEEIVLRVRAQGRAVPAQVVLYPGEDEWDCDCPGRMRPCDHLAASAIALSQAEGDGPLGAKPVQTSAQVWAR